MGGGGSVLFLGGSGNRGRAAVEDRTAWERGHRPRSLCPGYGRKEGQAAQGRSGLAGLRTGHFEGTVPEMQSRGFP